MVLSLNSEIKVFKHGRLTILRILESASSKLSSFPWYFQVSKLSKPSFHGNSSYRISLSVKNISLNRPFLTDSFRMSSVTLYDRQTCSSAAFDYFYNTKCIVMYICLVFSIFATFWSYHVRSKQYFR